MILTITFAVCFAVMGVLFGKSLRAIEAYSKLADEWKGLCAESERIRDLWKVAAEQWESVANKWRDKSRVRPFEGKGPERECLLRVVWDSPSKAEWIHFTFHQADGEYTEDGLVGHPDEYRNESGSLTFSYCDGMNPYDSKPAGWEPNCGFSVTHWAPVPEVEL